MVSERVIAMARRGVGGEPLLPEEVVAGRPAYVVEITEEARRENWVDKEYGFPLAGVSKEAWRRFQAEFRAEEAVREITWVDKEYGFPLAGRAESGGKLIAEFRAQEVRVNQGMDPAVFGIEVPAGVVTLSGNFGIADAETIAYALSEPASSQKDRISFMGVGYSSRTARYVLTLPRVPANFSSLGEYAAAGPDGWLATARYVGPAGATISYTQRVDAGRPSVLKMTGGLTRWATATPTKVGGRPGVLYQHQKPYPGEILMWEQQGVRAILETTGVPRQQLMAMAASIMALKVTREKALLLPDFATAASLVAMTVYRPSYLPPGAKLNRLTAADKGGSNPLQLKATYLLPKGQSLIVRQRQASDFAEEEALPAEQPVAAPGGKGAYYGTPSLTWKPKGSDSMVIISGRLSKAELLKIARSLKAVAPPR